MRTTLALDDELIRRSTAPHRDHRPSLLSQKRISEILLSKNPTIPFAHDGDWLALLP